VLYINQWMGSSLDWAALGLKLALQASHFGPGAPLLCTPCLCLARHGPAASGAAQAHRPLTSRARPADHTARASITILGTASNQATQLTLRLRIPAWTDIGAKLSLMASGVQSSHTPTPGSYFDITRCGEVGAGCGLARPLAALHAWRPPPAAKQCSSTRALAVLAAWLLPCSLCCVGQALRFEPPAAPSACCCRSWSAGDKLELVLPMRFWIKDLPEERPDLNRLKVVLGAAQKYPLAPGSPGRFRLCAGIWLV
jgi:hypothetical protein